MPVNIAMPPYPWLENQWSHFVDRAKQGRLPHALLLVGPEGLGGSALARAMGHYLLCSAPMGPMACGRCRSCRLVEAGSHPDLLVLEPEAPSTAIKVDRVRRVTEFVGQTAQQGGPKLVLIHPAEAMNLNAANALLKNLEEPAGRTHLLLVSYQPSRLLATIRSRCAPVQLGIPAREQALEWLRNAGVTEAEQLLESAGGQPLKVQRWFERDFAGQRTRMGQELEDLTLGRRSPLDLAKRWLDYDGIEVVDLLLAWVRLAVRRKDAGARAQPERDAEAVVELLAVAPAVHLFRYWDGLVRSKKQLLSQNNPNPELLLDELLMGWMALTQASGQQ